MKQRLAFTLTFLLSICIAVKAQVTIGSDKAPSTAALLDLKTQDNASGGVTTTVGGLLLPRVELQAVNSLAPFISGGGTGVDKTANKGLVVYNLTDNATFKAGLYAWDGAKWVTYTQSDEINANNGLSMDARNVQLGGTLSKATTIAAGTNTLAVTGTGTSQIQPRTTIGSNIAAPAGAALNIQTKVDALSGSTYGGATSDKGFLLPRVELTDSKTLAPIVTGSPTDAVKQSYKGLQVYNVGAAVEGAGVRVWDGTQWLKLVTTIPPAEVITSNIHNLLEPYTCGIRPAPLTPMAFGVKQADGTYAVEINQTGSYTFSLRLYGRSLSLPAAVGNINFYVYLMVDGTTVDAVEYPTTVTAYGKSGDFYQHYTGLTINLTAKGIAVGSKVAISIETGRFYYSLSSGAMAAYIAGVDWIWNSVGSEDVITPVRSSLVYYKL